MLFDNFIWDFDGTLFDTYPMITPAYLAALKSFGISADKKEIYRLLKEKSSAAVAKKYHLNFTEFTQAFHYYEQADNFLPKSFPAVKEVLQKIVTQGKCNMILTHRSFLSTRKLLEKEQLDNYFTEIVGPENNFPRKPDPSSLNYLLKKYQLTPEDTVMIGDRLLDVKAGKNAGTATVFFDNEGLLKNIPADYHVTTLKQIEDFI